MYIRNKPVAAFYKLALGALCLVPALCLLYAYSLTAFRIFPTWVAFIAAFYYLFSALKLALKPGLESGKNPCPMLEGMIIISFLLITVHRLFVSGQYNYNVSDSFTESLEVWALFLCLLLSILTLLDWILFVKKGRWRPMDPFYWLALPATYAATMIFTTDFLPADTHFLYPTNYFNYLSFGFWETLSWFLLISLLVLAAGYALFLIDFALSGKLAKKIVLPHLRVVEEEPEESHTEETTSVSSKANIDKTSPEQIKSHSSRPKSKKSQPTKVEIINLTPKFSPDKPKPKSKTASSKSTSKSQPKSKPKSNKSKTKK